MQFEIAPRVLDPIKMDSDLIWVCFASSKGQDIDKYSGQKCESKKIIIIQTKLFNWTT